MNLLTNNTKKELTQDNKNTDLKAASTDSLKESMKSADLGQSKSIPAKNMEVKSEVSDIAKSNPFLNRNSESAKKLETVGGVKSPAQIQKSGPRRVKKVPIPQMPIKNGGRGRLSVNLVPEDTLKIVKRDLPHRLKLLLLLTILMFAFLLFGWGALSWLQVNTFEEMQMYKTSIAEKELRIHTYKTQSSEIVKLRQRYDLIKTLLEDHVYWTKFFGLLERYTIDDVYYTSFSVKSDQDARITFNARGRNVEAIARQLKVFQDADDFIKDVRINGFSMLSSSERRSQNVQDSDIVSFDIIVTLEDDVFLLTQTNQN